MESAGHEVRLTSSGAQALDACLIDPPDIALLDVSMPGELDGLAVLRRLREEELTRDLRIVLLTAHAQEVAQREGLAAGADDYVVKPFDADELLARVASLLAAGPTPRG